MNYLQYMQNPAGPLQQIPDYLQAPPQDYQAPKPVDSFLGTDYVHNFIQKHKDVMGFDDRGNTIYNSPAYKINQAYMNQWNNSSKNVNGTTYLWLSNKQIGHNAQSDSKLQSTSKITSSYFPNRPEYIKITDEAEGFTGYLPTEGEFTVGTRNTVGTDPQWIKDQSKPDWFK